MILVAGWSLGSARLALGLIGLRRRLAGCLAIEEDRVTSLVEEIRGSLGCRRPVAVLESRSVAQPATFGWFRPCILLPRAWRTWSDVELRVVLAHELAHVQRADFATRVAGHCCLIVHFYHPLAHWLAGRLKLQQELAADAWGIALAGGRTTYLTTLARMTLRQDALSPRGGLDRPSLSFDGLFLRRMNMIGHRKNLERPPVTGQWKARLLTFGLLALAVVATTALRASPPSAVADEGRKTEPAAVKVADAPANQAGAPFDLRHLPADTVALVAVRPSALAAQEDVQSLLTLARFDEDFRSGLETFAALGLAPETVDEVIFAQRKVDQEAIAEGIESILRRGILIVKSKTPLNPKVVIEAARKDNPKLDIAFHAPDERTMILGDHPTITELSKQPPATDRKFGWAEAWSGVERSQVAMAFDAAYARSILDPLLMEDLDEVHFIAAPLAPIWDEARGISIGLALVGDRVEVVSINDASTVRGAEATQQTVQALLTLVRNAAGSIKKPVRKTMLLKAGGMEGLLIAKLGNLWADQILEGTRVERVGTSVRFVMRLDVDTLILLLSQLK